MGLQQIHFLCALGMTALGELVLETKAAQTKGKHHLLLVSHSKNHDFHCIKLEAQLLHLVGGVYIFCFLDCDSKYFAFMFCQSSLQYYCHTSHRGRRNS